MPSYDYLCESNGRIVEVSHKMTERLATWGDLCARAGLDRGDTPANSPVTRDRKSTRLNSSHMSESRMPSSA